MKLLALLIILSPVLLAQKPWIPDDYPVKPPIKRLAPNKVAFRYDDGTVVKPLEFIATTSLDGTWQLKPIETATAPFGDIQDNERQFAEISFDDSTWKPVTIPINWFHLPGVRELFTMSSKTERRGDVEIRQVNNPFTRSWLRRTFDYKPTSNSRAFIHFQGLAHSAHIFLNGKLVGTHHGDFVPSRVDVTDAIRDGQNTLALRILADLTPIGAGLPMVRTYGCMWSYWDIRGGIWLPVTLETVTNQLVIQKLRLSTEIAPRRLTASFQVVNHTGNPLEAIPAIGAMLASQNPETAKLHSRPAIQIPMGISNHTMTLDLPEALLWDTQNPNLYYAGIVLRNGEGILAAQAERFGFRELTMKDDYFLLNGKRIFLFFESAHSTNYGGHASKNGNSWNRDPYAIISGFKAKGYNMLRTAHQPIRQDYLDAADELGMMIWDEWGCAFQQKIDEAQYEKNNLAEVEAFLYADHNHASVVMWSMGNEVFHRLQPAIGRQLDKSVQLIRKLDQQARPICSFAGISDLHGYGREKRDTDFQDLHLYTGISEPWTLWPIALQTNINNVLKIYAPNETKLNVPMLVSECVGGGWGLTADPKFQLGNVDDYLERVTRHFVWAKPQAAGFSGFIPVRYALNPEKHYKHVLNTMGSRVLELARFDTPLAGIAPWFAKPNIEEGTRWNQPYMPFTRLSNQNPYVPRQILVPQTRSLQVGIDNRNGNHIKNITLNIQLALKSGKIIDLANATLPETIPFKTCYVPINVNFPETDEHDAELRITAFNGKTELGRNGYNIRIHAQTPLQKPIELPVFGTISPQLKRIADLLNINLGKLDNIEKVQDRKAIVLTDAEVVSDLRIAFSLRKWVANGGRLLILEPQAGKNQVFPEIKVGGDPITLVDMVVPQHPIFAGLTPEDLDIWAENRLATVASRYISPADDTLLAYRGAFLPNPAAGMALAEAKFENGRIITSTLDAVPIAHLNGAAFKYLKQLFAYLVAPENQLYDARKLKLFEGSQVPLPFNPQRQIQLPLPGIVKTVPETHHDVNFEVAEAPLEANASIPVNAKIASLCFLHSARDAKDGQAAGKYVIKLEDGSSYDCNLTLGINITNAGEKIPPIKAVLAGERTMLPWHNPKPDVTVLSITMETQAVQLYAITAETTNPKPFFGLDIHAEKTRIAMGCDFENVGATATWIKAPNPLGQFVLDMDFPKNVDRGIPYVISFFPKRYDSDAGYTTLSFLYKSDDTGIIDMLLPEVNWKNQSSRTLNINLADSAGEWIRVRFDIQKDLKLVGTPFKHTDLRSEVLFFNGRDKSAGWPREHKKLQVSDIRFE